MSGIHPDITFDGRMVCGYCTGMFGFLPLYFGCLQLCIKNTAIMIIVLCNYIVGFLQLYVYISFIIMLDNGNYLLGCRQLCLCSSATIVVHFGKYMFGFRLLYVWISASIFMDFLAELSMYLIFHYFMHVLLHDYNYFKAFALPWSTRNLSV